MFNKTGFMDYLHKNFHGFENPFLRETIENIIDFAQEKMDYSKGQLVYFLADIIPEINVDEVERFY